MPDAGYSVRHRRYCFSNGAYRGAGSDSLRQRFRVDVGAAAGALPDLPAGDEGKLCTRLLKLLAIQGWHEALLCCRRDYVSNLSICACPV